MEVGGKEEWGGRREAHLGRWRRMAQSRLTVTCGRPTRGGLLARCALLVVRGVLLAVAHDVGHTKYSGIIVRGQSRS